MESESKLKRNLGFPRRLWTNWRAVRNLLASDNFVFIRDFPPGHFYSPLPDVREALNGTATIRGDSDATIPAVNLNEVRQTSLLETFATLYPELPFPDTSIQGSRYYLDNPFFSYGDGITLYSMLRRFQPKRVVEVGSGFSSAAMLDINDRFLGRQIEFTFIEPYPERLHSLLSEVDRKSCRIEVKPVQQVALALFDSLEENDILFVDSSHVAKIGSDLVHILFEILPRLKKGVIVHFHDIFWPFDYPQVWLENGRAWNEAYFLRAFLQYNSAFEILYFNDYMARHHAEILHAKMPRVLQKSSHPETFGNSSLWLRKCT